MSTPLTTHLLAILIAATPDKALWRVNPALVRLWVWILPVILEVLGYEVEVSVVVSADSGRALLVCEEAAVVAASE